MTTKSKSSRNRGAGQASTNGASATRSIPLTDKQRQQIEPIANDYRKTAQEAQNILGYMGRALELCRPAEAEGWGFNIELMAWVPPEES